MRRLSARWRLPLLLACACGSGSSPGPIRLALDAGNAIAALPGKPGDDNDGDDSPDDKPYADKRATCTFKQGALPSDTFGPSIASAQIPIDTIVIVTQENHSFDEYFGQLPAAGQPDVDVEDVNVRLTNANGVSFSPYHEGAFCIADARHSWDYMHQDWDDGKNDGFLLVNGPSANPALGYYEPADLGFYYALATTYGVSDSYFSAVLGPTYPNRMYLYAGTSAGHVANYTTLPASQPTVFSRLKQAGVSFGVYSNAAPPSAGGPPLVCGGPTSFESTMFCNQTGPAATFAQFQADARGGTLPHVVWIFAGNDEHPVEDIQAGEADVQLFFDALVASPQWPRSAFILTYDEAGGYYDHEPPPHACLPDSAAPDIPAEGTVPGAFDVYGFRVPFVLASPYSRPHYVSHVVASHTSILRFLELRFGLPACSDRDANSDALLDFFDFSSPPHFATPSVPPKVIVANPSTRGC